MKNLWTEDAILWLGQAELDLSTARQLIVTASYAACFYAQQASEKALKSVYVLYGLGLPRVHSIGRLIAGLEDQFSMMSAHRDSAAILDGYYIGTRYPSAELGQIPGKNYTPKNAEDAVTMAEEIVRTCQNIFAQSQLSEDG